MDDDVQIRPATAADATGIALRIAEFGYPGPAEQIVVRLRDLAATGGIALVAVRGDQVLGMIAAQRNAVLHRAADDVRVTSLEVAAECRNLGIGRRLMAAAEAWARESGCLRVEVTSGNARREAHDFYQRLGFEQTSLRFSKVL